MIEGKITITHYPRKEDDGYDDGYVVCLSGGGAGACSAIERDITNAMRVASEMYVEELIQHGLLLLVSKGAPGA